MNDLGILASHCAMSKPRWSNKEKQIVAVLADQEISVIMSALNALRPEDRSSSAERTEPAIRQYIYNYRVRLMKFVIIRKEMA